MGPGKGNFDKDVEPATGILQIWSADVYLEHVETGTMSIQFVSVFFHFIVPGDDPIGWLG